MMPANSGEVQVGYTEAGQRHLNGLMRCGSVWACPMCAPIIRERRAKQLDVLYATLRALGYRLELVTSTVQHHRGHSLAQLLGDGKKRTGLLGSWRKAFSGRAVTDGPYVGQVKAVDLTVGDNGWHPHIHAVVVFAPGTDDETVNRWLTARRTVYLQGLAATGLSAAADERGWHVRPVGEAGELAGYMAKVEGGWGAGLEQARGDLKAGMRGGRTIWQVLQGAIAGDWDDALRWVEHEAATKGKRLIVVSKKLGAIVKAAGVDPATAAIIEELSKNDESQATEESAVLAYVECFTASKWADIYLTGRAAATEQAVYDRGVMLGFIKEPDS